MKITIVMPYYDRQYQLEKTLSTISKSAHSDFSLVIVDDGSPSPIKLPDVPFPVEIIRITSKSWTNCSPVWNYGFNKALEGSPDAIFLQSAECYHVGDVLSHVDQNLKEDNYLAYGCFQVDKSTTFSDHDIIKLSTDCRSKVTGNPGGNGQNAWWNHSTINPMPQYWGCAITANNIIKINGIDERFANGYAIEDGYFVWQIAKAGLRIDIIDYPFVVHQWHDRIYPPNVPSLVRKNKSLYESLIKKSGYRSIHTITPDLKWNGI